ncbi:MAG TPA: hypothetical protein VEH06_14510 [Candidatus Bathyarchaeia archaeon]|nr:hypothetical protein [Candidatus Bathyarchaeia archaeon]
MVKGISLTTSIGTKSSRGLDSRLISLHVGNTLAPPPPNPHYYIRWIAVLLLLAGLNLQLAAMLTVHYSAWHLLDSKRH